YSPANTSAAKATKINRVIIELMTVHGSSVCIVHVGGAAFTWLRNWAEAKAGISAKLKKVTTPTGNSHTVKLVINRLPLIFIHSARNNSTIAFLSLRHRQEIFL